jgi:hypothetical protein
MKALTILLLVCVVVLLAHAQMIRLPLHVEFEESKARNLAAGGLLPNKLVSFNKNNVQYFTTIYVGLDKQEMRVKIDTGSSWLWIQSVKNTKGDQFGNNKYNCATSKTCAESKYDHNITYSYGWAYGNLSYDTVDLGGGYRIYGQGMLVVDQSFNMTTFKADGFWGLTPNHPDDKVAGVPNIMDNLKAQGIISERVFSLYFSNHSRNLTKDDSMMIVGGYDPEFLLDDQFTTIYLIEGLRYWSVGFPSFKMGNQSYNFISKKSIIDCGASYIALYKPDWEVVFNDVKKKDSTCKMGMNDLIECQCGAYDDIFQFPDVTIVLGDDRGLVTLTLNPQHYIYWTDNKCVLQLQPKLGSVTRFGAAIVKNFYMLFNADKRSVGIARLRVPEL